MTQSNKVELRELILKKIEKLDHDISDLKELTKPISPENAIGRVSRMDAINNKSVNEASLRNAKQQFLKLNQALDNLDKENFGICKRCEQEIPKGRILFKPESVFCVNCAS